jgi:threonine/homoserine/homoserine lactone efflux protein
MFQYLLFGITYSFACVVQPGPFQAYLFSQSIKNGWRKTAPLAFAPMLSDIPVILLVLLVLIHVPDELLKGLQVFGGTFLLYLAYGAYQNWRDFQEQTTQHGSSQRGLFSAALVNLLNPNPYLGWSLVMGPWLLKGWAISPLNGIVLILGFYGSMVFYSILMIALFASAAKMGPRISRISIGISSLALGIFGIYQLWSGLSALVSGSGV